MCISSQGQSLFQISLSNSISTSWILEHDENMRNEEIDLLEREQNKAYT